MLPASETRAAQGCGLTSIRPINRAGLSLFRWHEPRVRADVPSPVSTTTARRALSSCSFGRTVKQDAVEPLGAIIPRRAVLPSTA